MNADQLKRKWMQFTGGLKRLWDKFNYNDDLIEVGGNNNKFIGTVQERYGNEKSALR